MLNFQYTIDTINESIIIMHNDAITSAGFSNVIALKYRKGKLANIIHKTIC